jgi:hypothetical protein
MIKIEISGEATQAQYTPLADDVLLGKTFSIGIVTEARIQGEGESLSFDMPIREHVGHLKAVLTAGEPIPIDQDTLNQIRYFHSSAFGAFLRIRLEIDSDFGYMIAPVVVDGANVAFDYEKLKKTRSMVLGQVKTFNELGFKEELATYISSYELATESAIAERDSKVVENGEVVMNNVVENGAMMTDVVMTDVLENGAAKKEGDELNDVAETKGKKGEGLFVPR